MLVGVAQRPHEVRIVWNKAPSDISLEPGCVHVFRVALDLSRLNLGKFRAVLAADESERAARFHFEQGRDNYVVARGVLRMLLGDYLKLEPSAVRLTYSAHGKPALSADHASDLQFNLSHSGSLALIAFTRGARIGVDIERIRPEFDGQRIADRFFTETEAAALRACPDSLRTRRFARQWTRKESFIKAHGEGLSYPLNAFSVLESSADALEIAISGKTGVSDWCVRDLDVDEAYAAALSVESPGCSLETMSWPRV